MVIASVFQELKHLDKVEGLVFTENKASKKVLEKAGFMEEGLLS